MLEVEAVPPQLYSVSRDWLEYCFIYEKFIGPRGSVVVKALCYKLEGRGFDSR
jgi:hypothetical protein